jgi:hypothetical protein
MEAPINAILGLATLAVVFLAATGRYNGLFVISSVLLSSSVVCLLKPRMEENACGCTSGFIASPGKECSDCIAAKTQPVFNGICMVLSVLFVVVFVVSMASETPG